MINQNIERHIQTKHLECQYLLNSNKSPRKDQNQQLEKFVDRERFKNSSKIHQNIETLIHPLK